MNRIVSICPSNTEILCLLGLGDRLVGVDDYSDWPDSVKHLPRLGPDLDIDMEKVRSIQPDWVLASLSVPGMEKNVERLQQAGIPHLVLYPKSIKDIPRDIRTVGSVCGVEETAERTATLFEDRIREIQERVPKDQPRPRLYWEWWPKPVFTPGRRNWLTDVSEIVGGINIFGDVNRESVRTDWETVVAREPDYTLIVWTGVRTDRIRKQLIMNRPAFRGKRFAQEDRIHILDEGWYCRPSPRLLTGIQHLAHILYPDRFGPPDPDHPLAPIDIRP
jgi:iron complex transport system substrate-binding protein